jgi:GMP synthase (glutamine-hydrolysing)
VGTRIAVVEHEPGCPPDRLAGWLAEAGCALDVRRPYAGDPLPRPGEADGLVVLGGRMGAGDDDVAPWLPGVRAMLREAVARGTPVLGVCLGGQLLGAACGGRVDVGSLGIEAGVVDVSWRSEAVGDSLVGGLPDPFPGPSMHHDAVVELPPGAVWLGSSPMYPHQVFRVGCCAYGVQFHPEVSLARFRAWAEHHPEIDRETAVEALRARDDEVAAAGQALAKRFAALLS